MSDLDLQIMQDVCAVLACVLFALLLCFPWAAGRTRGQITELKRPPETKLRAWQRHQIIK